MNPQEAIAELERRYEKVLTSDSDKAFFISLGSYVDRLFDVMTQNISLFNILDNKLAEAKDEAKEIKNYIKKFIEWKKMKDKPKEYQQDLFEYSLLSRGFNIRLATDPGIAWARLGADFYRAYALNSKKKAVVYSHSWNKKQEEMSDEFIELLYSTRKSKSRKHKSLHRETYQIYLTILHEFVISYLKDSIRDNKVLFHSGQTVKYENSVLYFDLGDLKTDSIDFSGGKIMRQIFEAFWVIRESKTPQEANNTMYITSKELLATYQKLFKEEFQGDLAIQISHIRNKKIVPKSFLTERFKIDFDKKNKDLNRWIFFLH